MTCPQLISDYSTPKISWYQTDLTVIIRIHLIDVSNYYVRVEDDHLLFRYIFIYAINNRKIVRLGICKVRKFITPKKYNMY